MLYVWIIPSVKRFHNTTKAGFTQTSHLYRNTLFFLPSDVKNRIIVSHYIAFFAKTLYLQRVRKSYIRGRVGDMVTYTVTFPRKQALLYKPRAFRKTRDRGSSEKSRIARKRHPSGKAGISQLVQVLSVDTSLFVEAPKKYLRTTSAEPPRSGCPSGM